MLLRRFCLLMCVICLGLIWHHLGSTSWLHNFLNIDFLVSGFLVFHGSQVFQVSVVHQCVFECFDHFKFVACSDAIPQVVCQWSLNSFLDCCSCEFSAALTREFLSLQSYMLYSDIFHILSREYFICPFTNMF